MRLRSPTCRELLQVGAARSLVFDRGKRFSSLLHARYRPSRVDFRREVTRDFDGEVTRLFMFPRSCFRQGIGFPLASFCRGAAGLETEAVVSGFEDVAVMG